MIAAPIPANELERLAALHATRLLDTPSEERFDRIVRLASRYFKTPIAYVALVGSDRQWFKSSCGMKAPETARDISFCGHAILQEDVMIVSDALEDPRFADNPMVVGDPFIRFYLGHPLRTSQGLAVGTLCIADREPRRPRSTDIAFLKDLAALVMKEIELVDMIDLQKKLLKASEENERLLRNILPDPIARRLREGAEIIADRLEAVTVLFADLVGFTRWAATTDPVCMVHRLNDLFSRFDACAQRHGVEKIKTIGDSYMAVAGLPKPRPDHAPATALMALEMLEATRDFNARHGQDLKLRIGLHSGPVVAGVIGQHKFSYDLWGDTVNVASRMESHGVPDRIHLSEATRECLNGGFGLEGRGTIEVKGKGAMETWLLA